MVRSVIWVIVFMFLSLPSRAQQIPLYSQYIMNGYLLNPAITGHDGYTTFNLTARQQWLGFKDAPASRSVSGETRLLRKSHVIKTRSVNNRSLKPSTKGRVGLGGFIYDDRNGAIERTGLQASYAYHIFIKETQMSFGLSAGIFQFKIDENDLTFADEFDGSPTEDPIALGYQKVTYVPDANLGFYVSDPRFYGGISVNQLFQSYLRIGNRQFEEFRMIRHYYLLGGYRFELSSKYILEPNFLFKATEKKAFQLDAGAKIVYNNDFWGGLVFRTNGTLIVLAGVKVKQLHIGYAFDYMFTAIQKHTYGSHEIVLALKLGDNARRYRWLNRY
jgi:type IX secretion system PorP/SprF family membrane protein